ncbi:hypothetical protein ACFLV0_07155 [Chloroflexota bacterium]
MYTDFRNRFIKSILIMALLTILLGTFTACEAIGYPPPSSTPQEQAAPEKAKSPTAISTKDAALLSVYQSLLDQAESYEAKIYLADFYATCDNWSAVSEFFKDGSDTWYVVVDMTGNDTWKFRPYWQQASWFVFKDGKVIPSNRFQANALRIEADLQALSPKYEAPVEP